MIHKPSHGVPRCPTKNLGPIGSAVLTFIGYKQTDKLTNKHPDKPNLYIENMFTINLEDGCEAPSKARKKGAKRLEFLVFINLHCQMFNE